MKIGIALSGGGIKSFSQLPVLEAIHKQGLNINAISGTSMGSAIAALVACGIDFDELIPLALEIEKRLDKSKVFMKPSPKILPFSKEKLHAGYVDGTIIETILDPILESYGVLSIRDVKIPLAIPSVDLVTGKTLVFISHPELFISDPSWTIVSDISLSKAVRASCSFPFVIAAFPYEDYLLTDGGVKINLPLDLIEAYGVDKTIAVTMHQDGNFDNTTSLLPLANRIMDLMAESHDSLIVPRADLHINIPLNDIWVFDIGKGQQTILEGGKAVEQHIDAIKKLSVKPSLWSRIKPGKK